MCFYENLGLTPAARYILRITLLLLILLYPVLKRLRQRSGRFKLFVLFGIGAAVNWVLAAVPWMRYNRLQGENWILKILGDRLGLPFTQLEPAFHAVPVETKTFLLSVFWVALCLVLTVWFLSGKGSAQKERN